LELFVILLPYYTALPLSILLEHVIQDPSKEYTFYEFDLHYSIDLLKIMEQKE
jgi:hypothetical protein